MSTFFEITKLSKLWTLLMGKNHMRNAVATPLWPNCGCGVTLETSDFLRFPGNFICCKIGPKVMLYFDGVDSHF